MRAGFGEPRIEGASAMLAAGEGFLCDARRRLGLLRFAPTLGI